MLCIFCFQPSGSAKVWCADNPGRGCTYGFAHEYPLTSEEVKQPVVKKLDKQICLKCKVHIKNPVSATNGCEHQYPN